MEQKIKNDNGGSGDEEALQPQSVPAAAELHQFSPIIIPEAMRAGIKRLLECSDQDEISEDDVLSIVFIIRIIEALHASFYASFLSLSLADMLRNKLGVPQLNLEAIEVYACRWSWNGVVSVQHNINWEIDMAAAYELSEIARNVLSEKNTPKEGLALIHDFETSHPYSKFETFYRNMPGRVLVLILLAFSSAFAFFKGTWIDLGFAACTAMVAGLICLAASNNPLVSKMQDMLISIVAALIATIGITLVPNGTCFAAEVLGTLFWFLYGTAFMISLTEIYNGQLVCGVTRLALALINTFGLAFGSSFGLWMAAYGGEDRFAIAGRDCPEATEYKIPELYLILFYPLTQIASVMQLKVKVKHWPITFTTQAVAVVSQYLIGTYWKQPDFVANVIPAYLATISARPLMVIGARFNPTGIKPWSAGARNRGGNSIWSHLHVGDTFHFEDVPRSKDRASYHSRYFQKGKLQYTHRNIWFCILPAMYLLVPGSSLLRASFRAFWAASDPNATTQEDTSALISVFIIGFGQAVGVRLGMTSLEAVDEYIIAPFTERQKDG